MHVILEICKQIFQRNFRATFKSYIVKTSISLSYQYTKVYKISIYCTVL